MKRQPEATHHPFLTARANIVRLALVAAIAAGAVALAGGARADDDTGPLSEVGKELAGNGIVLNANYFGEFAANPSGGAKQGTDYADQAALGADIDLQKLMQVYGGSLHIELTNRDGRNLASDTINNSVAAQQIFGGGQTQMLTTLTYEQRLFDDKLDIVAGRTEIDQVALTDPIYCGFQSNAICGQPDIMGKAINASFWPVPVWGADATVKPLQDIYVKGGVFDSTPQEEQPGHNGFDFAFDHSQGVLIPLETGYQTSFDDDAHPRRYDVGVVLDRTPYTYTVFDPVTTSLGTNSARDREMIYFQGKQMVYRPDANAQRGLTVFGALVLGPDSHQPADYNVSAGAVYQGIIDSRPDDKLGVMIGDTHYRSSFLNQLYDFRAAALGGTQRPASDLVMSEINYDYFITKWFDVMPNLQYIVNPDGLGGMAYPKANIQDAFVVGIQFNIDLAMLSGLTSQ